MDGKTVRGFEEIGVERLLNQMLEIDTIGIIFFDPEGTILGANRTFMRMGAYGQDDLDAGRLRWDMLTPEEWMPASIRALQQLRTTGSTVPYEKEYLRSDRTRFRGLFAAKAITEMRGVEFIIDVSEKHHAQELLQKSVERFRQLSESAPIGVFEAGLDAMVTYANARALQVFAMSEAEALGRGWLSRVCPEDAEVVEKEWPAAIAGDRPYEAEFRLEMPDGEIRVVCAHSAMLHGKDSKPFGVVGTVEDITSRKHAEATLRETEKLAAVGRLAASIAHEINNPLESVTNLLYLARSTDDLSEVQHYLEIAERELRRISVISSQTLRFHKQSTHPKELGLDELLDEVLNIHQGRVINAHVKVETRCEPRLRVTCYDGEVRQVMNNLIGNAVDAMHPNGGRLLVRCCRTRDWTCGRQGAAIVVADTGPGMSKAVCRRIFDAFYTTKGINGTGLGLWISRDIATRHQGKLTVRTSQREGSRGTVFRLFLPFDGVKG